MCISGNQTADIGTHYDKLIIGFSGLPIPILRKNYGRCCAEQTSCAIAKILSLMADERHVLLLALINVPIPSPPTVLTRRLQAAVSLLRGPSQ